MLTAVLCLQILLVLGLFAAYLVGGKYLPSYMTEKGKNLATKEDIEAITHKIESIKSTYTEQIERLRSSLALASSHRNAFAEGQRKALFQFFDRCAELLADKLRVNPGDLPMVKGETLAKHQQAVTDLITTLILDYHRIVLYCEPGSVLPLIAEKIVGHGFDVRGIFRKQFGSVKMRLIEETEHYGSGDQAAHRDAAARSDEAVRSYREAVKPHEEAMRAEFQKFLHALNSHLSQHGKETVSELSKEIFLTVTDFGAAPPC